MEKRPCRFWRKSALTSYSLTCKCRRWTVLKPSNASGTIHNGMICPSSCSPPRSLQTWKSTFLPKKPGRSFPRDYRGKSLCWQRSGKPLPAPKLYQRDYMKTDESPLITLLAIDDDPQNLELITAALEQPGLHILTATDPEAGLELFCRKLPQIVLCDFMMPKLSGMQVLEKIIAADPGAEVILMTAHYSTDSAVEAIQKGACDYLT